MAADRRRSGTAPGDEATAVSVRCSEPYDWGGLVGFLRPRAIPGVESAGADEYRRTISVGGAHGIASVSRNDDGLTVLLPGRLRRSTATVIERVSCIFDVAADPGSIAKHLRRDRLLQPLIGRWPGIRVPGAWDSFELAVRAVVGQQVSVSGATTIIGRIAAAHGTPVECGDGSLRYLFPEPERLAEAEIAGMPRSRAATIRAVAEAFAHGPVDAAMLGRLRGIGPWTVNYVAMRAWGDRDAFPAGDLGLRRAAGNLTERELEARSQTWRPWRAYAAMLLWRSL